MNRGSKTEELNAPRLIDVTSRSSKIPKLYGNRDKLSLNWKETSCKRYSREKVIIKDTPGLFTIKVNKVVMEAIRKVTEKASVRIINEYKINSVKGMN
ncbi:MAG: hypothetical protein QW304_02320 [Thermoproteota archaeon]